MDTLSRHWKSTQEVAAELSTEKAVGVPVDLIEKLPIGVLLNSPVRPAGVPTELAAKLPVGLLLE